MLASRFPIATQLGLTGLRLNRMISENIALYDIVGMNANYNSNSQALGTAYRRSASNIANRSRVFGSLAPPTPSGTILLLLGARVMPVSELKLVKRCVEFCEIVVIRALPLPVVLYGLALSL